MRGSESRVLGSGAWWPGILGPGRRRQDPRGPGWLPNPGRRWLVQRWTAWTVMLRRRWWPSGGHVQLPAGVQQRSDTQRSSGRHEAVHAVAGHDGRARVHELEHALHVLVTDALQDDGDAVVRAGMAEKQRLRTTANAVQLSRVCCGTTEWRAQLRVTWVSPFTVL